MARLSLSDADKQARNWFHTTMESYSCKVTIDEMGNMFAVRPGKQDGAPTFAGSHLDTQPTGGRYDGVLGVTAAVEMMRVIHENNVDTEYPIGVVNWTKYFPSQPQLSRLTNTLTPRPAKKAPASPSAWSPPASGRTRSLSPPPITCVL